MTGNREYKSDVFSMLMEEPQNALDLYNAVNGSAYTDASLVEICTLDRGISLTVHNDAAFVLDMNLSIYEHQSTVCPNMPVRSLIYFVMTLQDIIKDRNLYGRNQVMIPTPRFAVFYNGDEEQPEQYDLKLSDAYKHPMENPELELNCKVYNINYGKNQKLLEKCTFLREYMIFVDCVRSNIKEYGYDNLEHCIELAIDYCIENDILREFLIHKRTEVLKVMKLDYSFDRQLMLEREDSRAEGHAKGRAEGRAEGRNEKLIIQICKKLKKNKSTVEIADDLEEDISVIESICKIAEPFAPEYDEQQVMKRFLSK